MEAGGELRDDENVGDFDQAEWIKIWDPDFNQHVLDTSIPTTHGSTTIGPAVTAARQLRLGSATPGPSSRSLRSTEYDADDETTRILQAELNRSEARARRSQSATVAAPTPDRQINRPSTEPQQEMEGNKRKGKEPMSSSHPKRQRPISEPMSDIDVNVGANNGLVEYQRPGMASNLP